MKENDIKKIEPGITRRDFLKTSTSVATGLSLGLGAVSAPAIGKNILGANDKIRVGFIGTGNRGTQLMKSFMSFNDVEVAGLCDVYEPYILRDNSKVHKKIQDEIGGRVPAMDEGLGGNVPIYNDFREMLDQRDIDAVCISTPDHWHALQTVMSIDAGKDVFVEKPLSMTIQEGRKMVEVEQKSDRIVQVGIQRRSAPVYRQLVDTVRGGAIGKVSLARAYRISNMYPDGIGRRPLSDPPAGFDWDMWLGPRAFRPYQLNIAPYKFRWWKDYSSQTANWGVHYVDLIRWLTGERAPVSVSAHGGKYVLKDDRTIPDTAEVTYEFASGALLVLGVYEANGGSILPYGEFELRGAKANLYGLRNGYRIVPTSGGQFQDRGDLVSPVEEDYPQAANPTDLIVENFLDCIKSRNKGDLQCNMEEGHRSTTFALLANIALETGTRLEWDPEREIITNKKFANQFLHYEYRRKWQNEWESIV